MSDINEQNSNKNKETNKSIPSHVGGGQTTKDAERVQKLYRGAGDESPYQTQDVRTAQAAAGSTERDDKYRADFQRARSTKKINYKVGDTVELANGEKATIKKVNPNNETFVVETASGKTTTVSYDSINHKWSDVYKDRSKKKELKLGIFNQVKWQEPREKHLINQKRLVTNNPKGGILVKRKNASTVGVNHVVTGVDYLKAKPSGDEGIWLPFAKHFVNPETGKPYTDEEIKKTPKRWEGGIYNSADETMTWVPLTKEQIATLTQQGEINPIFRREDTEEKRVKADLFIVLGHPEVIGSLPSQLGAHSITDEINPEAPTDAKKTIKPKDEADEYSVIVSDLAWIYSEIVLPPGFRGRPPQKGKKGRVGYKDAALIAGWLDLMSSKKGSMAKTRFEKITKIVDFQKVDMIAVTVNDSDQFDEEQKNNLKELNSAIRGKTFSKAKYIVVDFAEHVEGKEDQYLRSEGFGAGILPNNEGLQWIMDQIEKEAKKIDAKTGEGDGSIEGTKGESIPKFTQKDLREVWAKESELDPKGEMRALIAQKLEEVRQDPDKQTFTIKDPRGDRQIKFKLIKKDGKELLYVV